jgi:hypothetical protein
MTEELALNLTSMPCRIETLFGRKAAASIGARGRALRRMKSCQRPPVRTSGPTRVRSAYALGRVDPASALGDQDRASARQAR